LTPLFFTGSPWQLAASTTLFILQLHTALYGFGERKSERGGQAYRVGVKRMGGQGVLALTKRGVGMAYAKSKAQMWPVKIQLEY
jgi:hypothetical protein